MNEKQISQLKDVLYKWKNISNNSRITEEGSELIMHMEHIAPYAWFHEIHHGLTEEDVELMESTLPLPINEQYKEFLKNINGMSVFNDTLTIYGFLHHHIYETALKMPFDLFEMNQIRIKGTPENWFFIASYKKDGSRVFFDASETSGKIYRTKRKEIELLNEWDSFDTWLITEIQRIANLYDLKGNRSIEDPTPMPDKKRGGK